MRSTVGVFNYSALRWCALPVLCALLRIFEDHAQQPCRARRNGQRIVRVVVDMAARMDTRRNDDVGILPANVDALAGAIRCRAHVRILRPLVNELIAPGRDVGETLRYQPEFNFQLHHCLGHIHINSEKAGIETRRRTPIAVGILASPRFNLPNVGRGEVLPILQAGPLRAHS